MKKFLLIILLISTKIALAQTYQEGDVFVMVSFNGNHDSTQCGSFGDLYYNYTIDNSFLGDSLLIKNAGTNSLIIAFVNTLGANPWQFSMQANGSSPFVPDYLASSGFVDFVAMPIKVKNGTDSIDNIFNVFQVLVPNPCSYADLNGRVYVDNNNDCVYNAGDGNLQSSNGLNVSANFNGSFFDYYNYNNQGNGQYSIKVQTSYLINGQLSYANSMLPFAYPNSCTPAFYNFDVNSSFPVNNLDFVLQCTGNVDVAAFVGASGAVRPGVPFMLYPHVSNMGCDTVSGYLQLILDNRVSYNPALSSLPPSTINGDTLIWNYGPISNLSNNGFWNSLTAGLYLTPDTTVNIGDTLCFSVSTNVPASDINAANNQHTYCAPVINSYDPNIKEVLPKGIGAAGVIPPTTEELTYTVYFQNTGNAPAINVFIIDTLDVNIIPESLEILGRSHEMLPIWNGSNIVRFNFNNINLMDSLTNEPASHGFVTFKVKLESNIPLGTEIENTAYIYFDFNAPIVTNTTLNTVDILTDTKLRNIDDNMSFYPNPATNEVTLRINNFNTKSATSIDFYTVAGQLVLSQNLTSGTQTIDVSQLNKGIYIMRVLHNGNYSHTKMVKE